MKNPEVLDRVDLKKTILEAARKKHMLVINDFRQRIKEALSNDGNANEEEYDNHQQSFQAGVLSEVNLLNNELEFVNHELNELRKIEIFSDTVHNLVQYGSVVRTNHGIFFVSASIERFDVDGEQIFGLSVHSPLYQAMKGKKAGDLFCCQGNSYLITEVF